MEDLSEFLETANWLATIILVFSGLIMSFFLLKLSRKLKAFGPLKFQLELKRTLSVELKGIASDKKTNEVSDALESKISPVLLELEIKKRENLRLSKENRIFKQELQKLQKEAHTLTTELSQLKQTPLSLNIASPRETLTARLSRTLEEMQLKMEEIEQSTFRKEFAFFILGLILPSAFTLLGKVLIWGYDLLSNMI